MHEIRQINFEILDFLNQFPLRMIVSGCNTSSAMVLEEDQEFSALPVLGLIEPTARAIARMDLRSVSVIATEGTVCSGAYGQYIRKYAQPDLRVRELACPAFVPLIENSMVSVYELHAAVRMIIPELEDSDALVFGCTHYPYLKTYFSRFLSSSVRYVDPAEIVADELSVILGRVPGQAADALRKTALAHPDDQFFTTGVPEDFKRLADRLAPGLVPAVRRVHLTTLELFGLSTLQKTA
jgi:glutamate racemase